jgi:hypothetical protein
VSGPNQHWVASTHLHILAGEGRKGSTANDYHRQVIASDTKPLN